jgi:hypothetical protein
MTSIARAPPGRAFEGGAYDHLLGKMSPDYSNGVVGPMVAELLD